MTRIRNSNPVWRRLAGFVDSTLPVRVPAPIPVHAVESVQIRTSSVPVLVTSPDPVSDFVPNFIADTVAVVVSVHPPYLKYVAEAIKSVDAQTVPVLEKWLVCDSCAIGMKLGKDWKVISGKWKSPGPGRNKVIKQTKAEWITFLDADDFFPSDYLTAMLAGAKVSGFNVGAIYPGIKWCDSELADLGMRKLPKWSYDSFSRRNHVSTSSLWRVEALRMVRGWVENVPVADDWATMMALRRMGWIPQHQPEAVLWVRRHGSNRSKHSEFRSVTSFRTKNFAIVSMLAGRWENLDAWSSWLLAAELPRHCDLYVLNDSSDEDFTDALRYEMTQFENSGKFEAVIYRETGTAVPDRESMSRRYLRHTRVAMLYNVILPNVCRCSDLVLLLEDDVVPPLSAFRMLNECFSPNVLKQDIAAVTALYPCRGGDTMYACSSEVRRWVHIPTPEIKPGLNICGCVPGGCTLYDSKLLLQCLPMRFGMGKDGVLRGWDGNTSLHLHEMGWKVAYHGDIVCEHNTK